MLNSVATDSWVLVQEVAVAAHDVQQLEEALALPAAPGPAAPIRASPSHASPAVPQQAVHILEPTAFDEQPVGIQALQDGAARPAGSAQATAHGQCEGLDLTLPGSPHAQVRNLAHCTFFDCCHVDPLSNCCGEDCFPGPLPRPFFNLCWCPEGCCLP